MAAIAHGYAEQLTQQTTTGTSYSDVSGASIASSNFVAGQKYLLLACCYTQHSASASEGRVQIVHGSTAFADSEEHHDQQTGTTDIARQYFWFGVWTAVSGEDVKMQFRAATGTMKVNQVVLFSMRLGADLTENTDWFYNEDGTDTTLATTDSSSGNASISFTPTAGHDWLVLTSSQISTTAIEGVGSRIVSTGTFADTAPSAFEDGDVAVEIFVTTCARVFAALAASTQTFTEKSWRGTTAGSTRLNSKVFALDLNKFKAHANAWDESQIDLSATSFGTEIATVSIDPTLTTDVLVLGWFAHDFVTGINVRHRIQVDSVDAPGTQTLDIPNNQTDNENLNATLFMDSMTTGAKDIDFDASTSAAAAGNSAEDRALCAFTMELAAPAVQYMTPASVTATATASASAAVATGSATIVATSVSMSGAATLSNALATGTAISAPASASATASVGTTTLTTSDALKQTLYFTTSPDPDYQIVTAVATTESWALVFADGSTDSHDASDSTQAAFGGSDPGTANVDCTGYAQDVMTTAAVSGAISFVRFKIRGKRLPNNANAVGKLSPCGAGTQIGTLTSMTASYVDYQFDFTTDPIAGGAWTNAKINAQSWGVYISSLSTYSLKNGSCNTYFSEFRMEVWGPAADFITPASVAITATVSASAAAATGAVAIVATSVGMSGAATLSNVAPSSAAKMLPTSVPATAQVGAATFTLGAATLTPASVAVTATVPVSAALPPTYRIETRFWPTTGSITFVANDIAGTGLIGGTNFPSSSNQHSDGSDATAAYAYTADDVGVNAVALFEWYAALDAGTVSATVSYVIWRARIKIVAASNLAIATVQPLVKGVVGTSETVTVDGNFFTYTRTYFVNPATGVAWAVTDFNSGNWGVDLTVRSTNNLFTGSPEAYLSEFAVEIYTPVVTTQTMNPASVQVTATVGASSLATAGLLNPASVALTAQVGAAALTQSAVTMLPASVAMAASVGAATLVAAPVALAPAAVAMTVAVGAAVTVLGTAMMQPASVGMTAAVGASALAAAGLLTPASVSVAAQVGAAVAVPTGAVNMTPASVGATATVNPASTGGQSFLTPGSVALSAQVPAPTFAVTITPASVGALALVGTATLLPALIRLTPLSVGMAVSVGASLVWLNTGQIPTTIERSYAMGARRVQRVQRTTTIGG